MDYPRPGISVSTDASGIRKEVATDTLGRVKRVREGKYSLVQTGAYRYDARARVIGFEDGNHNHYFYNYDGVGRLRDVSRAARNELVAPYYGYKYRGPWVTAQLDHAGQEIVWWGYDALYRATSKKMVRPTSPLQKDQSITQPLIADADKCSVAGLM